MYVYIVQFLNKYDLYGCPYWIVRCPSIHEENCEYLIHLYYCMCRARRIIFGKCGGGGWSGVHEGRNLVLPVAHGADDRLCRVVYRRDSGGGVSSCPLDPLPPSTWGRHPPPPPNTPTPTPCRSITLNWPLKATAASCDLWHLTLRFRTSKLQFPEKNPELNGEK